MDMQDTLRRLAAQKLRRSPGGRLLTTPHKRLSIEAHCLWKLTSREVLKSQTRHVLLAAISALVVWDLAEYGIIKIIGYVTDVDTWGVYLNCACAEARELKVGERK